MSLIRSINKLSIEPLTYALPHAAKAESPFKSDEDSCGHSIKSRFLYLTQIIASLVAIPILIVAGLFETIVRSFSGEGCEALSELFDTLKFHVLVAIPGSFVGIFAPLEKSRSCAKSLLNCYSDHASTKNMAKIGVDLIKGCFTN